MQAGPIFSAGLHGIMGVYMLTGLLQVVVHWAHHLEDCVGALAVSQELTGSIWEQQEHLVAGLEFLGLGWSVVSPLLLSLCCLYMFLYDGGDAVDPLLHFLYIVIQGLECRGLLFLCFSGHIQQSSEETFEGGELHGCLWHLLDGKKDVGKEEVLVSAILIYHSLEHPLEHLVEMLHQTVGLGVVDGGPEVFHLQQPTQITH